MSWLDRVLGWAGLERRAAHTLKEVGFWLSDEVWGGPLTDSGLSVSAATAMQVPEVYACVTVIAHDVAACPIKYQHRTPDGDWYDVDLHDFWDLLRDLPNPETTGLEFWSSLLRDLQLHERAYAEIVRRGTGEPYQLWRLDPQRMSVTRDALGRKRYEYRLSNGRTQEWTFDAERPPLLELSLGSWVRECRNLIGYAAALDLYGAKYFANAARPSGVLVSPTPLSDEARERLAKAWRGAYGGVQNAHKVAVLEQGVDWKPLSVPNNESQFLEMRRYVTERICGVAGVPPHKVAELSRSTNNNIEQQSRDYLQRLNPYFRLIEQVIRRDLLTSRTWPRYRAVFDRESIIQIDSAAQASAFSTYLQNGVYSPDDVRRKLKENPIGPERGGDRYHVNGTMVPLEATSAPARPALLSAEGVR